MCFKKYKIFPILIYSPGDKNIEVTECCISFNELKDPIHLECDTDSISNVFLNGL